jgi:putative membrane protein
MSVELIARYVHFISIFAIVAALSIELVVLKPVMRRSEISSLSRIDGIYGIAAITLLAAGFTLLFGAGKPADYYSKNYFFLFKLLLFTMVGIASAWPTVFFLKNRKGNPEECVVIPGYLKKLILLQLIILFLIPAFAGLMAKGIGYFG